MGKNYIDSNGNKLISTTKIAFFISLIPCIITLSFYPLIITILAPIIDFFIEKKMLFEYDENGELILGRDDKGNPIIRPVDAIGNTKTVDKEAQIKQAYGINVDSSNSDLQLPNEWLISCLSVIIIAPVVSVLFIVYLGSPLWWLAWWSSLWNTMWDTLWSLIL